MVLIGCYHRNNNKCYYFDSFRLNTPIKLLIYLSSDVKFLRFQVQKFNTHHCGYYCLLVLKLLEKYSYRSVILCLKQFKSC